MCPYLGNTKLCALKPRLLHPGRIYFQRGLSNASVDHPKDPPTVAVVGSNSAKLLAAVALGLPMPFRTCITTGGLFRLATQFGRSDRAVLLFLQTTGRVQSADAELVLNCYRGSYAHLDMEGKRSGIPLLPFSGRLHPAS